MLSKILFLFFCAAAVSAWGTVNIITNQDSACLSLHNRLRAKHRETGPLVIDPAINANAREYAKKLARTDTFTHSGGQYGENLYSSSGSSAEHACETALENWYGEISKYNFRRPGYTRGVGHFTQMVWKSTTRVGFGIATIGSKTYVVAQYSPSGNYRGSFKENVEELK